MFGRRKINALKELLEGAELVIEEKDARIGVLEKTRVAMQKENASLRVKISDLRNEFNDALKAKETERRELCDRIEELRIENEKMRKKLTRRRDNRGRFAKKNETK